MDTTARRRLLGEADRAAERRGRSRLGGWGVELALAASILLAVALTALFASRPPASPAGAAGLAATTRETCRALDRDPQDWECRRLAIAERAPASGIASPFGTWVGGAAVEGGMP